jgi:hypothetical protein
MTLSFIIPCFIPEKDKELTIILNIKGFNAL